MKVTFFIPHKRQETLEIDPEASGDDVSKILISKYGFPEGEYSYIYMGLFLPKEGTFKKINSKKPRVVVFIKTPEEIKKEKEAAEEEEMSLNNLNQGANLFIDNSQLDVLYSNPDMWTNLDDCAEMRHLLMNQQNLYRFINHDINHPSCPGRNPNNVLNTMLLLLDVDPDDMITAKDIDAAIFEFTAKQKEEFSKIYNFAKDNEIKMPDEEIIEIAKKNEFDFAKSCEELKKHM